MERCRVCGAEEFIPYVCRYCGGTHCVYHRLPENHECPNIEQARAPKPIVRAQHKGSMLTLRPRGVPRLSRVSSISTRELSALLIAWVVLGFSFSVKFLFGFVSPFNYVLILVLTMVVIGTGFIGHELAHKFTAEKYGCWAEFKLWTLGAVAALVFSVVSQGQFIFAAPGAVYIASRASYFGEGLDKKSNAIVSIMGPVINVVAALAFLGVLLGTLFLGLPDIVIGTFSFLREGVILNLWLGAFNMLPIFVLDGQKVFSWDKRAWALFTLPLWIGFFAANLLV